MVELLDRVLCHSAIHLSRRDGETARRRDGETMRRDCEATIVQDCRRTRYLAEQLAEVALRARERIVRLDRGAQRGLGRARRRSVVPIAAVAAAAAVVERGRRPGGGEEG